MIIDSHVHVLSFPSMEDLGDKIETTEDLIAFRTRYPDLFMAVKNESPIDNSVALFKDMERYGVSYALIQARPGNITNQQVAEVARKHADRLFPLFSFAKEQQVVGYAKDTRPVVERAAAEIPYLVETLGMKGMGETPMRALTRSIHPEDIADDLEPILAQLDRFELPMQIMTAWTQFKGGLWFGDPIWADEVAARHPRVRVILTKMGRGIQTYFDHAMTVALRNVNVYFDTVGTSPQHLRFAVDKLGPQRIMFGTDWSGTWRWVRKPADVYSMRLKVIEEAGLSLEEREWVLWRTAATVFKLPVAE